MYMDFFLIPKSVYYLTSFHLGLSGPLSPMRSYFDPYDPLSDKPLFQSLLELIRMNYKFQQISFYLHN